MRKKVVKVNQVQANNFNRLIAHALYAPLAVKEIAQKSKKTLPITYPNQKTFLASPNN